MKSAAVDVGVASGGLSPYHLGMNEREILDRDIATMRENINAGDRELEGLVGDARAANLERRALMVAQLQELLTQRDALDA